MAGSGRKIFISYRREDAGDAAARIRDWLVQARRVAREGAFMDVTAILPGADFMKVIESTISQCHAMVVVISPSWLADITSSDTSYVRAEVELALEKGLLVIPVVVGGARMPDAQQLPEKVRPLLRLNIQPVRHESFDYDMGLVGRALGRRRGMRVGWVAAASAVLLVALSLGVLSRVPEGNPIQQWLSPPIVTSGPASTSTSTPTLTATSPPAPTATLAPKNPYGIENATFVLADSLFDNNQGHQWRLQSNPKAHCGFVANQGMHCLVNNAYSTGSYPQDPQLANLRNLIFEVNAAFSQTYGSSDDRNTYSAYELDVRFNPQSGIHYAVELWPDAYYQILAVSQGGFHMLAEGSAASVFQIGGPNTIALIAQGSSISLYINYVRTRMVTDSTFDAGGTIYVGDGWGNTGTEDPSRFTDVVFSQLRVWALP